MLIKDVADLDIYKESLRLIPKLYKFLSLVPYSEKDTIYQTKKAAKAIPAHITEGFAKRKSNKEFKRYLMIALGSSDEVVTHLKVILIIIPELTNKGSEITKDYITLSKRINVTHQKWNINNFLSV